MDSGNINQLGFTPLKTRGSMGPRVGRITRGVGSNRPRIHLVSTGMKVPGEVYAEAVAARQARMQAEVNRLINAKTNGAGVGKKGYDNNANVSYDGMQTSKVPGTLPQFKQVRRDGGVV